MLFQAPFTLGGLPKPTAQQVAELSTPTQKLEDLTQMSVVQVKLTS